VWLNITPTQKFDFSETREYMKNIMAQNFYTHILASALGRMHSHCLSSRYYYRHVLSAADATVGLSQVSDADFDRLMNYDDKCFVRPGSKWRREFISRWIKIPGGRSVMAVNHRGDVIGYGCRIRMSLEANYTLSDLCTPTRTQLPGT